MDCHAQDAGKTVDNLVSEDVAVFLAALLLHQEAQELNKVCLDVNVEANDGQDVLQKGVLVCALLDLLIDFGQRSQLLVLKLEVNGRCELNHKLVQRKHLRISNNFLVGPETWNSVLMSEPVHECIHLVLHVIKEASLSSAVHPTHGVY